MSPGNWESDVLYLWAGKLLVCSGVSELTASTSHLSALRLVPQFFSGSVPLPSRKEYLVSYESGGDWQGAGTWKSDSFGYQKIYRHR